MLFDDLVGILRMIGGDLRFYDTKIECPKDLMMRDDLVGILRIAGRGRAVRYILVITASSNVITVVMIRVIAKKTPEGEGYTNLLSFYRLNQS